MNKYSIPGWLLTLIALSAAIMIALYIRIVLPYQTVFSGPWIKLTSVDGYYYLRLVDNLVVNFPRLIGFDPYQLFPGGDFINRVPNLFVYILTIPVKLLGGISPSSQAIESITVYIPPILGALTVIPVYFLGRTLTNRWGGLIAAFIVALMPGEWLLVSLLGNTTHHVAEVFFTSCFVLFFILALKYGREFTYEALKKGGFPTVNEQMPYAIIAGIFFGFYIITWQGAPLYIFIIFMFFVIQFINDHLRGFPTDYLSKTAIMCFLVTLLIVVPVWHDKITILALASIILVPVALNIMSAIMDAREVPPIYYLVLVAVLMAATGLTVYFLFPQLFETVKSDFLTIFTWRMDQNTVGETKSVFFPAGFFTMETAWNEWALMFYSGLAGLALLIYAAIRKGHPEYIFIAVWSLIMMLAAFALVRFSYYFSICLGVLTAFLAGYIIRIFDTSRLPQEQEKSGKKARKAAAAAKTEFKRSVIATAGVLIAVAILLFPGTSLALAQARDTTHTPSDAWMEAMQWLKDNSPEPLGDSNSYYSYYNLPEPGTTYQYPSTAYGIAVWPDYGYWVMQIGHRIPVSNPGSTGIKGEVQFFSAQDNTSADAIMNGWGAKYVVTENRLASPNDKFYALAGLANRKETDFYELCWQKQGEKYVPKLVFYPEFYRTMIVRLYDFDGLAVTPQYTTVMAYSDRQMPDGQTFKEITGLNNFRDIGDAEAFISSQKQGQYKIVGTDPLVCPVPLEQLKEYKLVYESTQKASSGSSTLLPAVKIFQYSPSGIFDTSK
ncbi:MAG: oligosaccharyl transferase, archaeosortase A system-associated [Dehalococcoidia bacterium]|jgi:dolichyl-diphosphooligosaccharide--protein glycosyltransferase